MIPGLHSGRRHATRSCTLVAFTGNECVCRDVCCDVWDESIGHFAPIRSHRRRQNVVRSGSIPRKLEKKSRTGGREDLCKQQAAVPAADAEKNHEYSQTSSRDYLLLSSSGLRTISSAREEYAVRGVFQGHNRITGGGLQLQATSCQNMGVLERFGRLEYWRGRGIGSGGSDDFRGQVGPTWNQGTRAGTKSSSLDSIPLARAHCSFGRPFASYGS